MHPSPPTAECRIPPDRSDGSDTRCDLLVARRAAAQWGVVSLGELIACGVGREAISERCRRGWLHRLHCAVYAVGHPNPPREGWLLAAVKACGPDAVLSHASAAEVWGLTDRSDRCPEVTVHGSALRVHQGIRVHRTKALERRDIAERKGIALTTPVRTVIDLAAVLPHHELRRIVRQAQSLRRVRLRQLSEGLIRLGSRRGVRKLRCIIAGGPAPTRSELEDVVLDLFLAAGFAHPNVNEPMRIDGRWIVPDLRWPEQRLVVEADGGAWHDHKLAREDDAQRQALLESAGERVLRVTWAQAIADPQRTLARIRTAGAPLAHRVSDSSGQV